MKSLRVIVENMDFQSISTNMCEEDFVSLETAKLLKEKGFNEVCEYYFILTIENQGPGHGWHTNSELKQHQFSKPTLQQAVKWLRSEGFHIFVPIDIDYDEDERGEKWYHTPGYYPEIYRVCDGKIMYDDGSTYTTPEQACDVAIKYCLENFF